VHDQHQLHLARHARRDLVGPGEHLCEHRRRVGDERVGGHARTPLQAQVKARDDTEEARACTARRPQQVGVLALVRADELTVGGDDVDRLDAHACGPGHAAVPAVAALKQVAAEADARAVAGGEEQVAPGQRREQLVAAAARLHLRGHRRLVDVVAAQRR
jgi:hypothetical protein